MTDREYEELRRRAAEATAKVVLNREQPTDARIDAWVEAKELGLDLPASTRRLSPGEFLRKKREESGHTLRSLAKSADVPAATISDAERGMNLRFRTFSKIAHALGVTAEEVTRAKLW